ncbi:hypothetical protein NDU88_005564 [Pleurodeles waltl]|uniref:Uncharacterized protein n=1 Tax=Pleurodeles waltl TaxID=8319 RepID=A0AAV7LN75_PLEWA|nr:hypothetical protein NDU88_005564 [Pleurodeles waltl]
MHAAEPSGSPTQLRQLRRCRHEAESTLSRYDYRTRMALQHAQGDRSGKLSFYRDRHQNEEPKQCVELLPTLTLGVMSSL